MKIFQEIKQVVYEKKLNVADWLSIYRIFAAPVIAVLAFYIDRHILGLIFIISLATDALDGYLARKWDLSSELGARLDSTGDALIFLTGMIAVIHYETQFLLDHKWVVIIALGLYFLQLGLAYYKYGRPSSFHTYAAKAAALVQGIFLITVFFFDIYDWLFYLAIAISVLETLEEIYLIFYFDKWTSNVQGIFWIMKNKNSKSE